MYSVDRWVVGRSRQRLADQYRICVPLLGSRSDDWFSPRDLACAAQAAATAGGAVGGAEIDARASLSSRRLRPVRFYASVWMAGLTRTHPSSVRTQ